MTLLLLDGITKSYGGVRALGGVGFEVKAGEIVGLMGANGAGKTTLFSIIGGHEKPDSGELLLNGQSLLGLRPDHICRLGIARTFQIVRPFRGLSVLDNAMVGASFGRGRAKSNAERQASARACLDLMGLLPDAEKPAEELTLSGQKRLEVARALATEPDLLLLDEVMAGLTALEVSAMLDILSRLRAERGLTLLVIEHVMQALMRLSDRIVVLHHGQVIAQGAPQQIAEEPAVRAAYLGSET